MQAWDTTTFELTESRLRLKSGLHFAMQRSRHGNWYLIEDESRGTFFRVGPAEYTFISLLDGDTTLATAMARTCSLMGASALDENEAIQLCNWLVESGLAHTDASVSAKRIEDRQDQTSKQKTIQRLNPISVRVPLWNPDKLVTCLTNLLGWMVSWPFALLWIFTCTYAAVCVSMDWERLVYGSAEIFTRNGLVWMAGTWIVLKVAHELAHAIVCKKFGGKTGDFGILFLLMIPLPYVDVTSSWRFSSKYRRILVSAGGMLAEIFIAAIAAIIWFHSGPGIVAFNASNVIFAASLHTLLFNANPLLKFDGYHILADWLEIPNMGTHGQRYVLGCFRKWFLGLAAEPIKYAGFHGTFIKVYGWAALVWRISLCLVLGLAAANMFHGVGLLIALMASVLWLGLPAKKFAKYMIQGTDTEQPNRKRFSMVVGAILVVGSIGLAGLPAPSVITAPAVIEYDNFKHVRSETPGFVREIFVQNKQVVQAGQLLVRLENPGLETVRIEAEIKLQEAQVRANLQQKNGDIGALQIELESVSALEKQLAEIEQQQVSLEVRAPVAGRVISTTLHNALGTFIRPGTELLGIGDESRKSAVVLIAQEDAPYLNTIEGRDVMVRIWGHDQVEQGDVNVINPRSQNDVPHFAFAGMYGGPLNVADRKQMDDRVDELADRDLILINSRIQANISFDNDTSQRLYAGQTGLVHVRGRSESLGSYMINGFQRWFRRNLTLSHGI